VRWRQATARQRWRRPARPLATGHIIWLSGLGGPEGLEQIDGTCDGTRAVLTIPSEQDSSATIVLRFEEPSGEVVWEYGKHVVMLDGERIELPCPSAADLVSACVLGCAAPGVERGS
jgi:hypothetical protein